MRRTQIYLDEEQAERLDVRATQAGTTRSGIIRAAIDAYLGPDGDRWTAEWHEALKSTAGAAPYIADDHVERMRGAGAKKLTELDSRAQE